jgi:EAL domain-containing protein (putative c-di-GMP-specific phosphodiesterase class I)
LQKLPLDQLKIDQSFVRNLSFDGSDSAIVKTIINLGENLSLNIIAEGVETMVQCDFLADFGCLMFQGYLFGRPLPIDEFKQTVLSKSTENIGQNNEKEIKTLHCVERDGGIFNHNLR